jgi:hypothetical protein
MNINLNLELPITKVGHVHQLPIELINGFFLFLFLGKLNILLFKAKMSD